LVHITVTDAPPPAHTGGAGHTSGVVDHVAFTCGELASTIARFETVNVKYVRRDFPELGFTQLVVRDPLGLSIELNFNNG